MLTRRLPVLFAGLGLLPARLLLAGELLVNGGFDSGVAPWQSGNVLETSLAWSPLDAGGSSGSGSALVTTKSYGAASQCFAASGAFFDLSAKIRVPSGQPLTGSATVLVRFYATTDCSGAGSADFTLGPAAGRDAWETFSLKLAAPPAARSGVAFLTVGKGSAGTTFGAHFDDVSVKPSDVSGLSTLTFPGAASIHGKNGTFFHTDLWVMNRSYTRQANVLLRYRCFSGQSCPGTTIPTGFDTRAVGLFPDVVAAFFGAPETAGVIELTYDPSVAEIAALSRTYTPAQPAAGYGVSIPAQATRDARTRGLLLGVASSGGDPNSGFRSNVGAYNPNPGPATVTFTMWIDQAPAGTPVSRTLAGYEAIQINDIFAAAGLGATATTSAALTVTSSLPVFSYLSVVDNQSGDSIFVLPVDDNAGP